jgi:Zn-dependent protease with chaperone function
MSAPTARARSLGGRDLASHGRGQSSRRGRTAAPLAHLQPAAGGLRPAQRAARRTFTVNAGIGVVALASILFVITRLAESWRVGSGRPAHSVSVFGQTWSYPAANAGAIVITALAGFGLVVLLVAIRAAVREIRGDRAFRRVLASIAISSARGASVVEGGQPRAFCAGLLRPRAYVSRGAVEMLGDAELSAVIAHERHHARRRDPLRLAGARVLADALFFVPPLRTLVRRQHSLAEIGADEAALAALDGDRAPLAGAMLVFSDAARPGEGGLAAERIDYLVGERPDWSLPLASVMVTCFALAVLVTLAALMAEAARGSATLAPPIISAKPCVVMLALIPSGVAAAGLLCARRRRLAGPRDPYAAGS